MLKYQIKGKSLHLELSYSMWTGGQTNGYDDVNGRFCERA